jgi:PKD repeat protein
MNLLLSASLTGIVFLSYTTCATAFAAPGKPDFEKTLNNEPFSITGNWCDGEYTLVADFGEADGTWNWMKDGAVIESAVSNQLNLAEHGAGHYTATYQSKNGTVTISESFDFTALPGPKSHFVFLNDLPIGATRFADNSKAGDAPIVEWHWDFGDGTTATEKNPVHPYAGGVKKTYTVVLTTTDSNGCSNSVSILVEWK